MTRAGELTQIVELAAELPPRQVRLRMDVVVGAEGLSVAWEALGAAPGAGMMAGSPAEVARAVGALVLRLAGAAPQVVQDEEPTRRLVRS